MQGFHRMPDSVSTMEINRVNGVAKDKNITWVIWKIRGRCELRVPVKSCRINTVKKLSVLESSWLPEPKPKSWLLESNGSSVFRTESNHSGNQGISWQLHVLLRANREVREMLTLYLRWIPNKCCNDLENNIYWPWVSFPLSASWDGKSQRIHLLTGDLHLVIFVI